LFLVLSRTGCVSVCYVCVCSHVFSCAKAAAAAVHVCFLRSFFFSLLAFQSHDKDSDLMYVCFGSSDRRWRRWRQRERVRERDRRAERSSWSRRWFVCLFFKVGDSSAAAAGGRRRAGHRYVRTLYVHE